MTVSHVNSMQKTLIPNHFILKFSFRIKSLHVTVATKGELLCSYFLSIYNIYIYICDNVGYSYKMSLMCHMS